MRHIITKAQTLGKKAAEMRQAMQNLPGQAAKMREAVTMTGLELHQLRGDVQTSINALKADNEERLLKTMREVHDHAEVFLQAGYSLHGMDLDMALNQRLAVHLEKMEDVPHATLRALASGQTVESVRSILLGIIKAEETAANVELSSLQYAGLVVHAGPLPMIRMQWRNAAAVQSVAAEPATVSVSTIPQAPVSSGASLGSIFEPRPMPSAQVRPAAAEEPTVRLAAAPTEQAAKSAWSSDALQRFKQMPGGSKYGR